MIRKMFLMLLLSLASAGSAAAQHIALGERIPEFRSATWLDGHEPQQAPLTWILFFHSANPACRTSLERLGPLRALSGELMQAVIVVCEENASTESLLRPLLSDRTAVALDPERKIFAAFGVNYVPYGVLADARNRALWQGNALRLDNSIIEQHVTR